MSDIKIGETYAGPYPFVRAEVDLPPDDPEGTQCVTVKCWKPGVLHDQDGPYGEVSTYADGVGQILLTVVDVHRPGRFPPRVFFTRQWRDPDGKVFGKGGLRITTQQAFRRLARGYRHDYEMSDDEPVHPTPDRGAAGVEKEGQ